MKKLILSFVFMLASAWVFADGGQRNTIVVPVLPQALQVIDNNDCGCKSSEEQEGQQALRCKVYLQDTDTNTITEGVCWFCDCTEFYKQLNTSHNRRVALASEYMDQ